MANRRDLHISIDGDAKGFDTACEEAEAKAKGLDQELAKLERQQAANEKVTTRTAAAVKKYGAEQDKAALAARRLGSEAQKAAQQAEQAQVRSSAAAEAYMRGLVSKETALRAAARAEDATERASIKAAEAHRAAARAAEDQAQQERQLARDAAIGAAAEDLAIFKSSGRVKDHNNLLHSLKNEYGDLSKTAAQGFQTIETFGGKATNSVAGLVSNFSILGTSAPVSVALIIAAIESLPTAATIAGGGIAVGLGGALTALALKAQASAADVQSAFEQLKMNVTAQFASISAPFHGVLMDLIADAQGAFNTLVPSLEDAFKQMAPEVSRFAHAVANSASAFDPVIRSIATAFSNTLDNLSADMGTIMGNIATGIKAITDAVAANPQALSGFAVALSEIIRYVGDSIGLLIRYSSQINTVIKLVNPLVGVGSVLLSFFGGSKKAAVDFGNSLNGLPPQVNAAAVASQALAKDLETLSSASASAEDKTNAMTDAFTRLLDPQAAMYSDTLQLRTGIDQLGKALALSGGYLDDTTQASAAAGTAFGGMVKNAQQLVTNMLQSGDSIDSVRKQLWPYIGALAEAAGSNQQAQGLVAAFAKSLGLTAPALDKSGHAVGQFGGALDALRVPTTAAQLAARQFAEDMVTLSSKTATAEDKANALSDAFTRLLDPALAAYQDTSKLRQGLDDLSGALKKSHGALNDNSAAARASKDAFASLLKDAETFAGDLLRSGDSLDTVQRKLTPYILSLYKAAGGNKDAKALVDALARSLGLVPNKKGTTLTSNAASQTKAIDAYRRSLNALHSKTITIRTVYTVAGTTFGPGNKKLGSAARGGLIHRADGGPVARMAGGGPSGMVVGPGTGTSDSIPTMLSNGEYVINARATAANRSLLEAVNSGARIPVGAAAASSSSAGGGADGSAAPIDYDQLAGALTQAMRREGVGAAYIDGQSVTNSVSRRIGQQTSLRRRSG